MATGFTEENERRFDAAQRDKQFRAWVEMTEAVLELEFDDVPELGDRPWGKNDLDLAEKRCLELVPSIEECFGHEHQALSRRFVRFLGQTLIDYFEGEWVNVPQTANRHAQISVLRGSTRDKAAMEKAVTDSGLAWTIVRPAILTDDPALGHVRAVDPAQNEHAHKIARNDLAAWLVEQLDNSTYLHRAVTIATS